MSKPKIIYQAKESIFGGHFQSKEWIEYYHKRCWQVSYIDRDDFCTTTPVCNGYAIASFDQIGKLITSIYQNSQVLL